MVNRTEYEKHKETCFERNNIKEVEEKKKKNNVKEIGEDKIKIIYKPKDFRDFKEENDLEEEMKEKITRKKENLCEKCNLKITEIHEWICPESILKCNYCKLEYSRKEFNEHEISCSAISLICDKCNKRKTKKGYKKNII